MSLFFTKTSKKFVLSKSQEIPTVFLNTEEKISICHLRNFLILTLFGEYSQKFEPGYAEHEDAECQSKKFAR